MRCILSPDSNGNDQRDAERRHYELATPQDSTRAA
jgi:hypothetical protein